MLLVAGASVVALQAAQPAHAATPPPDLLLAGHYVFAADTNYNIAVFNADTGKPVTQVSVPNVVTGGSQFALKLAAPVNGIGDTLYIGETGTCNAYEMNVYNLAITQVSLPNAPIGTPCNITGVATDKRDTGYFAAYYAGGGNDPLASGTAAVTKVNGSNATLMPVPGNSAGDICINDPGATPFAYVGDRFTGDVYELNVVNSTFQTISTGMLHIACDGNSKVYFTTSGPALYFFHSPFMAPPSPLPDSFAFSKYTDLQAGFVPGAMTAIGSTVYMADNARADGLVAIPGQYSTFPMAQSDGAGSSQDTGTTWFAGTSNAVPLNDYLTSIDKNGNVKYFDAGTSTPLTDVAAATLGDAAVGELVGNNQSAAIGATYKNSLQVQVADPPSVDGVAAHPLAGVSVTFSSTNGVMFPDPENPGGPPVASVTVQSDSSGIASTPAIASTSPGNDTVQIAITDQGSSRRFLNYSLTALDVSSLTALRPLSGNLLQTKIGTPFGPGPSVVLKDSQGDGIPNYPVTFTAPPSGASGTFSNGQTSITVNTSLGGVASPTFTANAAVGDYSINVSAVTKAAPVQTLTTALDMRNLVAAPANINPVSGSGQTVQVNTAFSKLEVEVTDSGGNPVSGVNVSFKAQPSQNSPGASATFATSPTGIATNANGLAWSPNLTANSVAGEYQVTASVDGTSIQTAFDLTNAPGGASSLKSTDTLNGSASATVGSPFPEMQVQETDSSGNPVPNRSINVTITPASDGASASFGQSGALSETLTTNANGTVDTSSSPVFANAKPSQPNTHYQLTFKDAKDSSLTAVTYNLTNVVGPPTQLVPQGGSSPQSTKIDQPYTKPVAAVVEDKFGNPIGGVQVLFSAPGASSSGSFGTAGAQCVATSGTDGVADAGTFTANDTAGQYVVNAVTTTTTSTNGIPGCASGDTGGSLLPPQPLSTSFTLTNLHGDATYLKVVSGSAQSPAVGTTFADPLQVQVTDAHSNPVPGVAVEFTTPTSSASATWTNVPQGVTAKSPNDIVVTTDSNGMATTPLPQANGIAGQYQAFATMPTGTVTTATFQLANSPGSVATFQAVSPTNPQQESTPAGTAFAKPFTVHVADLSGNPVQTSVAFTIKPDAASGASATFGNVLGSTTILVPTDTKGNASVATTSSSADAVLANQFAGTYTLEATVGGATPVDFQLTNTAGTAANLAKVSGDQQTVQVGNAFGALTVKVTDANTNSVGAGVPVTFTVQPATSGNAGATFPGSTPTTFQTITTASGEASTADSTSSSSPGLLTANATAGTYTVKVTAGSAQPVIFTLTNQAGAVGGITKESVDPQTVKVGQPLAALKVQVTDGTNPVGANVPVTFTVQPATNGNAGATFPGSTPTTFQTTTNTNGEASTADPTSSSSPGLLTANTTAGTYTVQVAATGAQPVTFTVTNQAGAAATVVITNPAGGNAAATVGAAFAPLSVQVTDQYSNPVADGVSVKFQVQQSLTAGSAATATFPGATAGTTSDTFTTTTANGVASTGSGAGVLTASDKTGSYPLEVTVNGAQPATFTLSNTPDVPNAVAPQAGGDQHATIGGAYTTNLAVLVTDAHGNPVAKGTKVTFTINPATNGATGTFSTSALTPGAAAVISGSNTTGAQSVADAVTDDNGVATAPTLTANSTAGQFTVTATTGTITPAASFTLTNDPATANQMVVHAGDQQQTAVGTSFTTPLSVLVQDASKNPVPGVTVTFTAPSSGASGTFTTASGAQATAQVTTGTDGIATAPALTANATGGQYTVKASATGITTPASFTLDNQQPPSITSKASTTFTSGTAASFTITTTGTPTPVLTSTGNLPNGVTFTPNSTNGTATLTYNGGTIAAGTFPLTFTATNAAGHTTQSFTLTVSAPTKNNNTTNNNKSNGPTPNQKDSTTNNTTSNPAAKGSGNPTPGNSSTSSGPSGNLAHTGASIGGLAVFGIGLILGGVFLYRRFRA
ncbi:beta strand repeat-containing protein [Streptacidiphilus rugosus]|uniref:beta strand repeat-containing protein n=1 Tax=Streptacidiphilus rugosus TaxID=405783 RepID=UPI0012FCACED|nr:hypothetical protein [Streptacidiphilus rugosus]